MINTVEYTGLNFIEWFMNSQLDPYRNLYIGI